MNTAERQFREMARQTAAKMRLENELAPTRASAREMQVICVANQKGGVGKTTTAAALAAGLSLRNYKTLAVDLDAQQGLTRIIHGAELFSDETTILEAMRGEISAESAIIYAENFDLLPASKHLIAVDDLPPEALRQALEPLRNKYDYCIIDTPPNLGTLTLNALTAARGVVIPARPEILSIRAILDFAETVETARILAKKHLEIIGILLTQYSDRATASRQMAEYAANVAETLKTYLFKVKIRQGIAASEAQIFRKSIFCHAPSAGVTRDYKEFIREFLTITHAPYEK